MRGRVLNQIALDLCVLNVPQNEQIFDSNRHAFPAVPKAFPVPVNSF